MRRIIPVVAGFLAGLGAASAADMPDFRQLLPPPLPIWTWSGFYTGGHLGGGLGVTKVASPNGPTIFGDDVRTPTVTGGLLLATGLELGDRRRG